MGRSRCGLTTKVAALVDAEGRPIALKLTEGQAHDGRSAADMFDTVQAGHFLLGDRAYDSVALRDTLFKRGAWGNIRLMPNRKNRPAFSSCEPPRICRRLFGLSSGGDAQLLDIAIHRAATDLNAERNRHPLVRLRISA
jgi:transposase